MAVEGVEDGSQKSMRQQHARRGDVDDGDAFFGRDGFEEIFAMRSAGGDSRSFASWIARVQNINRNIFLDRRQDGRGMQNFGAEVCQLGSFVEADDFDPAGVGTDLGSVVIMPSTSVQISIFSAPNPAPTMAAEKSDPPRPIVVVIPARFAPIKPPITGTRPAR